MMMTGHVSFTEWNSWSNDRMEPMEKMANEEMVASTNNRMEMTAFYTSPCPFEGCQPWSRHCSSRTNTTATRRSSTMTLDNLSDMSDEEIHSHATSSHISESSLPTIVTMPSNSNRIDRHSPMNTSALKRKYEEWTKDLDHQLETAVRILGCPSSVRKTSRAPTDSIITWNTIAESVGRSGKQCRERWMNHLRLKNRRIGPWSKEEWNRLEILAEKYGKQWSKFVPFFPGRSSLDLRNKWFSHQRSVKRGARQDWRTPLLKLDLDMSKTDMEPLPLTPAHAVTGMEPHVKFQTNNRGEYNQTSLVVPTNTKLQSTSCVTSPSISFREEDVLQFTSPKNHSPLCDNMSIRQRVSTTTPFGLKPILYHEGINVVNTPVIGRHHGGFDGRELESPTYGFKSAIASRRGPYFVDVSVPSSPMASHGDVNTAWMSGASSNSAVGHFMPW